MVMKLMKWNWFIKFEKINAVIKLVWFDGMREFKLNEWRENECNELRKQCGINQFNLASTNESILIQQTEDIQFLIKFEFRSQFEWLPQCFYYYNSKYIDAEETDVSRNQTSTWLMNSAEVVSKEEIYSSGN